MVEVVHRKWQGALNGSAALGGQAASSAKSFRHVLLLCFILARYISFNDHNMAQSDEMQVDSEPQDVSNTMNVKDGKSCPGGEETLLTACKVINSNLDTIHLAVQQYDIPFILRALRGVSSIRKKLSSSGNGLEIIAVVKEARTTGHTDHSKQSTTLKKSKTEAGPLSPEEEIYLAILEQVSGYRSWDEI